jgi:hypothetical protein
MKCFKIILLTIYIINSITTMKRFRIHSPCGNVRTSMYNIPSDKQKIIQYITQEIAELKNIKIDDNNNKSDVTVCSLSANLNNKHAEIFKDEKDQNTIDTHNYIHLLTESGGESSVYEEYYKLNESIVIYFTWRVLGLEFDKDKYLTKEEKLFVSLLAEKLEDVKLYQLIFLKNVDSFFTELAKILSLDEVDDSKRDIVIREKIKNWEVGFLTARIKK